MTRKGEFPWGWVLVTVEVAAVMLNDGTIRGGSTVGMTVIMDLNLLQKDRVSAV